MKDPKVVVLMSWEGHSRVPRVTLYKSYEDMRKRWPSAPADGDCITEDFGAVEWDHVEKVRTWSEGEQESYTVVQHLYCIKEYVWSNEDL